MDANARLQLAIGQYLFRIAALEAELEKAQARIAELEASNG